MRPTYSLQKRQVPNLRQNQTINVDRVRVVEIHDATQEIEPINLESESSHNRKIRPFRFNLNTKLLSNKLYESKKQIFRDKNHFAGKPLTVDETKEQRENIKPFKEYREKVHKLLSHFMSIASSHPSNKISSESVFNLFQQRKSLENKFEGEASLTKFLFDISYTNYLSFLLHLIPLKQTRYEIYSEPEELDKVLSLIDEEIQNITQTYLTEQEKKLELIFTEELLQEASIIARKTRSKQTPKIQQNPETENKIMLENDEKIESQRDLIQIEPENTDQNQLAHSSNEVVQSKTSTKENEESKFRIVFNSESESCLEEGQILATNGRIEEQSGSGSGQLISSMEERQLFKENEVANNQQNEGKAASDHADQQNGQVQ